MDETQVKDLIAANSAKIVELSDALSKLKKQNEKYEQALNQQTVYTDLSKPVAKTKKLAPKSYLWRNEIKTHMAVSIGSKIDGGVVADEICKRDGIEDQEEKQRIKNGLSIAFSSMFREKKIDREKKVGVEEFWYFAKK